MSVTENRLIKQDIEFHRCQPDECVTSHIHTHTCTPWNARVFQEAFSGLTALKWRKKGRNSVTPHCFPADYHKSVSGKLHTCRAANTHQMCRVFNPPQKWQIHFKKTNSNERFISLLHIDFFKGTACSNSTSDHMGALDGRTAVRPQTLVHTQSLNSL